MIATSNIYITAKSLGAEPIQGCIIGEGRWDTPTTKRLTLQHLLRQHGINASRVDKMNVFHDGTHTHVVCVLGPQVARKKARGAR